MNRKKIDILPIIDQLTKKKMKNNIEIKEMNLEQEEIDKNTKVFFLY